MDTDHITVSGESPSAPFKHSSGNGKSKGSGQLDAALWARPNSAPALLRGQGLLAQAEDVVRDGFLQNVENHAVRNSLANLRRGYLQTRDIVNDVDCLSDTHLMELRVRHNRKQRHSSETSKTMAVEAATVVRADGKRKKDRGGASQQVRNLCELLQKESIEPMGSVVFVSMGRKHKNPRGESVSMARDFASAFNFSASRLSQQDPNHRMSRADVEKEVVKFVQFLVARFGTISAAWGHVKNNGKSISGEDWKARLLSLGYDADPDKIFSALDQDGNRVMTWEELEEGLHTLMPGFILKSGEETPPKEEVEEVETAAQQLLGARHKSDRSSRQRLSPTHALDAPLNEPPH